MMIGVVVVVVILVAAAGFYMMKKDSMKKSDAMMKTDTMQKDATQPAAEGMQGEGMKEEGVMVGGAAMLPSRDIVDNAVLANNVTTVVAAVKAAGLVETLKGPGPFTVFAPNNAAFEKLPAGTVDTLLKPENKEKLTSILTYHVVPGRYLAKDLTDGLMLKTVNGQELKVSVVDGKTMINGSMIETADVISSNGVTFVIDSVMMPQ